MNQPLPASLRDAIAREITRYPHPRGALVDALRMVKNTQGELDGAAIEANAMLFSLSAGEVAEVASFYPLLNTPPAQVNVQVCTNLPCALRGARALVDELQQRLGIKPGQATADRRSALTEVECLGSCGSAPVIQINDRPYLENATSADLEVLTRSPQAALEIYRRAPMLSWIPAGIEGYLLPPDGESWLRAEDYRRAGGYRAIGEAVKLAPAELCKQVEEAGLRGRGGAGFLTGRKWAFMPPKDKRPRYLAVNADESEPATFKDRQLMERNPHLLMEGILIAAWGLQADAAYIYLRAEYIDSYERLRKAIEENYQAGIFGPHALGLGRPFEVQLQRGAGAYICGEESGMLESMEGKKGQPRKRPPFPAQHGLWGQPTTVDNVETLSQLPAIVMHGAQWFREQGVANSAGHTLFGVSGHVNRPGIFELPLGVTMREVIERHAGGVSDGRPVKAVIPGGVSMPVITAQHLDLPMDHESLKPAGSLLGTAGMVVMDDRTCMVRAAQVVAHFFRQESCGQCTQCREGTAWLHETLGRIESGVGLTQDIENLESCCDFMDGQCICALADGAAWAVRAFVRNFREEFLAHLSGRGCPFQDRFRV